MFQNKPPSLIKSPKNLYQTLLHFTPDHLFHLVVWPIIVKPLNIDITSLGKRKTETLLRWFLFKTFTHLFPITVVLCVVCTGVRTDGVSVDSKLEFLILYKWMFSSKFCLTLSSTNFIDSQFRLFVIKIFFIFTKKRWL